MTAVAREILTLLGDISVQKNGRGVTLLTLSELWRGTKAKSHTKFLNTATLTGYGNGSKYTKHDVDTIAHAMVFEKILEEIPEGTASGFSADYVSPGKWAQAVQNGMRQFFVRFAVKKAPEPKETKKKASKKKKNDPDDDMDTKPKAKKKGKSKKKSKSSDEPIELLDSSPESAASAGTKRPNETTVLTKKHTHALLARIKKIVSMWAEEVSLEVFSTK